MTKRQEPAVNTSRAVSWPVAVLIAWILAPFVLAGILKLLNFLGSAW